MRPPLERVLVRERHAVEADAREHPVEDRSLEDVRVRGIAGGEQETPGQHDARDGGARFGVGTVGRQFERVAERLVAVAAADAAGQVAAGRHHVASAPKDRLEQLLVAELDGDVDRSAVEVELADGMTGNGRRGADRRVVLPVRGAEATLAEEPVAASRRAGGTQAGASAPRP